MNDLCATSLAQIVRGVLRMSSLPPLGGAWEPVYSVRLDAALIQPGDVLLTGPGLDERVVGRRQFAEEAFARQAVGIVTAHRTAEPWAGTFVVHVADARTALMQLAQWYRTQYRGTLVAVLGGVRGDRVTEYLEALLTEEHDVQRLRLPAPYDAVSMANALLDLRVASDVALCTIPVENSEQAGRASQLCRPDFVVNDLRPIRQADALSIRELRACMLPTGRMVTAQPLPALSGAAPDRFQTVTVGTTDDCDIEFQLEAPPHRAAQIRYGASVFGPGLYGTSDEEDMLLLATCLELGMTAAELKRAWRRLTQEGQRRAA